MATIATAENSHVLMDTASSALSDVLTYYLWPERTTGISATQLEVSLPRNSFVEKYLLRVRAVRANVTPLAEVAQVRALATGEAGKPRITVVADFGKPRTVNLVGLVEGNSTVAQVSRVRTWNGAAFNSTAAYTAGARTTATEPTELDLSPPSTRISAVFPEVSTQKLEIELVSLVGPDATVALLLAGFPDPPADLELRIEGGAPIWTHPGPVLAGANTDLNAASFNTNGERLVDIAGALTALNADPVATDSQTYTLQLTSSVPGVLELELAAEAPIVKHLVRVTLDDQGERSYEFKTEGRQTSRFTLPAWATSLVAATCTIRGQVEAERILPAVGPEEHSLAELVLSPERTAATRLASGGGLATLMALRVPLSATGVGAEIVAGLHEADAEGGVGAPLGVVSAPVTLRADEAAWCTFTLSQPFGLDESALPWVVLTVTRGVAIWTLGSFTHDANPVRLGTPSGAWRALPGALLLDSSIGGRLRIVGKDKPEQPVAAAMLRITKDGNGASSEIPVRPSNEPRKVALTGMQTLGALGGDALNFEITSRALGSTTATQLDLLVTK